MLIKSQRFRRNKLISLFIVFLRTILLPQRWENLKSNASPSIPLSSVTEVSNKVDVKPIARDIEISDIKDKKKTGKAI